MSKKCIPRRHWITRRITPVLLAAVMIIFSAASCKRKESDDSAIVNATLRSYMTSLCEFDISAMNRSSLCKLDEYSDSQSVKESCKLLAERISWNIETVSINGSTAIAQIKVTRPDDFERICSSALEETMVRLEQDPEAVPSQVLHQRIGALADTSNNREYITDVALCKTGNTWCINKSQHLIGIISEIRTPVAAVYSVIEQ